MDTAGPVLLDTTPNTWRIALDPTSGRFHFISPDNKPTVLRGISMTGAETGTRETAAGGGFWLYLSNQIPEATNAPTVLKNVVKTLVTGWKTSVVRIPICGSAWAQNYSVHDWGNAAVANYRDWVDAAVQQARSSGAVVIIDNHLWAIAKMGNAGVDRGTFTSNGQTHKYSEYDPKTTTPPGLCAGDRTICGPKSQAECQATDASTPAAGGWSRYVLPMAKYGPLIATEFGSFDCSSPFVSTLMSYMTKFDISYTAWALWPQNNGGPPGLGSCGYPSVMTPVGDMADFHQCFDASACASLMQPLPWAGAVTHRDLMSH